MISYEYLNLNPKGKKTCDCVIRALSLATGKSYEQVYREIFEISLKTGYMLNEKRVEDKFLEQNGFIKIKQPKKFDGTKYTIGELDWALTNSGRGESLGEAVIVRCAHHLTCVKDGVLYETWDCRRKCISNYFIKVK